MNDKSIITFGEHKGKEMADVPDTWLIWFWGENNLKADLSAVELEVIDYIKDSFEDLP